ncbi:acetylglutamate kinase [Lentiprolixibacter aurantiacus]|uniref:Acetylglutamate kinase n=1 Tax=Lentiprolixibacter aurantiacus TaxID=2993939 RepID=A0AAE3SLX5_9FLAO|nr:acetylglutamate kinase [Lentiprolixibacter aurantiacus]MCX2718152.1 acetylglutamate kinase [Lentiprolixibacter aurantiacus]
MKRELSIVKIGGNVIENSSELNNFLRLFSALDTHKILVHGGGKKATEIGQKLGIKSKMIEGRRITDAGSLDVALMVYAGLVNKKIVGTLQAMDCNALGLSGADANLVQAYKRPVTKVDFGLVGDISGVNASALKNFLEMGMVPVFCALTHDQKGQMLNTNADTIAAELAIALSSNYKVTLYYCFEKQGVLMDKDDEQSVIPDINWTSYQQLITDRIITDGMLPKMENSFRALKSKVARVCIGNISMLESGKSLYTTLSL